MQKTDEIKVLGLQQFGAENPQFYIRSLSNHLQTSHLHIDKPHKHDFFVTVLFTQGSGTHEIDFNTYMVRPGSVFVLSRGQTHDWKLSADCEGIIFFHSQDFYDTHYLHDTLKEYPFFSFIQNQSAIFLDKDELREIQPLFEKILHISTAGKPKTKQLILSLVTQIYIGLETHMASYGPAQVGERGSYYAKFLKFEELVEKHFWNEKSARQYASWMNVTPKHLNRINKMIVNKTTSGIIADRVVLEAKRMLIYAKSNLNEVADALGFADYAHFSKLFKNKTGLTPSAFSKRYT